MPVLSIISGAYNLENCFSFKNSVESILSQGFNDFEFIICDDGSTDNTYGILKSYADRDPRIKLLKNESNMGLAATLNRCISEAKGEFIARHDCDDYAAKDRLEKQVAYLREHPEVDILGSGAYLFDESGVYDTVLFPRVVKNEDFLFNSPYQHGSVVFRRGVLEKAGGYTVSKATRRTEDYEMFMRMQSFARGENLPEPLYYFLEDEKALKRRKYRYRIDEARVRYRGFKSLGLLPRGIFYVIKPLIVGLIPVRLLAKIRKKRRQRLKYNE
jgi:glycosyltransferase involved in cell wall biosynthesis